VVSLSNHERRSDAPFDRLRANGLRGVHHFQLHPNPPHELPPHETNGCKFDLNPETEAYIYTSVASLQRLSWPLQQSVFWDKDS
jgi:hypothetical protein